MNIFFRITNCCFTDWTSTHTHTISNLLFYSNLIDVFFDMRHNKYRQIQLDRMSDKKKCMNLNPNSINEHEKKQWNSSKIFQSNAITKPSHASNTKHECNILERSKCKNGSMPPNYIHIHILWHFNFPSRMVYETCVTIM